MNNGNPSIEAIRSQSRNIELSALVAVLIAAMPKCPICWMTLVSALGAGSVINASWSQPLAAIFLFLPVSFLLARARRRHGYGPFFLGLIAAIAIFLCKFRLNCDIGVYLGGAILLGASVWDALLKRRQQTECSVTVRRS